MSVSTIQIARVFGYICILLGAGVIVVIGFGLLCGLGFIDYNVLPPALFFTVLPLWMVGMHFGGFIGIFIIHAIPVYFAYHCIMYGVKSVTPHASVMH